jgi:hypothetical protein
MRRMRLYIGGSQYQGLAWAVFEPNDEPVDPWTLIPEVKITEAGSPRQGATDGTGDRLPTEISTSDPCIGSHPAAAPTQRPRLGKHESATSRYGYRGPPPRALGGRPGLTGAGRAS